MHVVSMVWNGSALTDSFGQAQEQDLQLTLLDFQWAIHDSGSSRLFYYNCKIFIVRLLSRTNGRLLEAFIFFASLNRKCLWRLPHRQERECKLSDRLWPNFLSHPTCKMSSSLEWLLSSSCSFWVLVCVCVCVVSVIVKAPLSFDNEHLRRSWSAKARLIHSNIAGRPLLAPLAALNYQGRSLFCHIRLACRNLMRRAIPNGWFCIGV